MTDREFALTTYWDDCLKAAKVNLFTGELVFIKTLSDEERTGICDIRILSDYTKSIVDNGLIFPADQSAYLYHADIDRIRKRALENKMKSTHTFRRKLDKGFAWVTYEITTPKNFSEEEPWALLTWREADSETRVMEDAMFMLSTIFHKILKVDLTGDTHEEIKVYEDEMTEESGYDSTISGWWRRFAECGNIYWEDVREYYNFTDIDSLRARFRESRDCVRFKYRRKTADGFRWVCMEILPSLEYTDEKQEVMLYIRDIHDEYVNELERQKELEYWCSIDSLTGIGNRYCYNKMVSIFEERPDFSPVGVVFADVNGLKYTNDNFGHSKGDELIRGVAQRLSCWFGSENCCRISGDEFVVLVKNAERGEFVKSAEEFRRSLSENGSEPPASIGFAWIEHSNAIKTAVRFAETNMYADKQEYYNKYPYSRR